MTAAFMWPGAEEPIGTVSTGNGMLWISLDHDAIARQGLGLDEVRRGVGRMLMQRYRIGDGALTAPSPPTTPR